MNLSRPLSPRTRAISLTSIALFFLSGCGHKKKNPDDCPVYVLDSANTPIKGSGGALTIFSKSKWQPAGGSPDAWCATFDSNLLSGTPSVSLVGFDSGPVQTTFDGPWELYGHTPDSSKHSANGIRLNIDTTKSCSGGSGKASVLISIINPESSPNVGFYARPLPHGSRAHDDKRFKNSDPKDGCDKDEDLCERLAFLHTPKGDYNCVDGDCSFTIGPVQAVPFGPAR